MIAGDPSAFAIQWTVSRLDGLALLDARYFVAGTIIAGADNCLPRVLHGQAQRLIESRGTLMRDELPVDEPQKVLELIHRSVYMDCPEWDDERVHAAADR